MKRRLYDEDHEAFREVVRTFVRREVAEHVEEWEHDRLIPRSVWLAAGSQGLIGLSAPEDFGGAGKLRDYRYRNVVLEELAAVHATSLASSFSLQDDIAIPYIADLGNPEQQARWLPGMAAGEIIGAIAMTEPGTGSDLQGIRTSAAKVDGGWIVNGAKTFITSGLQCDLVIAVCRTSSAEGASRLSLMVIERGAAGFQRGRKLDKIGLHGQDTAELFFEDVFVPDHNVLGDVGGGFGHLQKHLPLERLSISGAAVAGAQAALTSTLAYTNERSAFGQPVADFQNSRFVLADVATEIEVARSHLDAVILAWNDEDLSAVDAAKAKLFTTEMQNRVVDRCLQLHGGYGYMIEYPIARAFQDARIQRIFGGTSEIMRLVIGRDLVGRR